MKRAWILLTILLITFVALTACGSKKAAPTAPASGQSTGGDAPAAAQPTAAAQAAPTAAAPAAAPTTKPTAVPEPTKAPAEDTGALPTGKGLPKSYIYTMEMKEEVLKPTKALENWVKMEIRFETEPAPGKYAMTAVDQSGEHPDEEMKLIVLADAIYIFDPGEGKWTKLPRNQDSAMGSMADTLNFAEEMAKETAPDVFTPAHMVSRHESIDGVDCTHYRLKDKEIDQLQQKDIPSTRTLVSGQVDFWIANQGDYLKKYMQDSIVDDEDGRQLHVYYEALVTDENKPVKIEAPPADQVIDMMAEGIPGLGAATAEAPSGEAPSNEVSAAALAFFEKLPAPPQSRAITAEELPDSLKFAVLMAGAGQPARHYISDASLEDVRAFYKKELTDRGLISFMDQVAELADSPMNMYASDEAVIQLLTDTDPATGKTMISVMLMVG